MEAVDPSKQDRFCNSFHDEAHDIDQGLYASLYAAIDGHRMKWAEFCQDVALIPYLSRTGIRCLSSTHLRGSTRHEPSPPADIRYNPAWLRTPYD